MLPADRALADRVLERAIAGKATNRALANRAVDHVISRRKIDSTLHDIAYAISQTDPVDTVLRNKVGRRAASLWLVFEPVRDRRLARYARSAETILLRHITDYE